MRSIIPEAEFCEDGFAEGASKGPAVGASKGMAEGEAGIMDGISHSLAGRGFPAISAVKKLDRNHLIVIEYPKRSVCDTLLWNLSAEVK